MRENIERVSVGGYYLPSGYGHMHGNPQSRPPLLLTYEILGFILTLLCRKGALLVCTSLLPGPRFPSTPSGNLTSYLSIELAHQKEHGIFHRQVWGSGSSANAGHDCVHFHVHSSLLSQAHTYTLFCTTSRCRSALWGSFSPS